MNPGALKVLLRLAIRTDAVELRERLSGEITRTVMNWGCEFDQTTASRFVSKNRSITSALFWAAFRPQYRAAFRLTTAEPVSTATHSKSGNTTLLPYGIFRGSTAQ